MKYNKKEIEALGKRDQKNGEPSPELIDQWYIFASYALRNQPRRVKEELTNAIVCKMLKYFYKTPVSGNYSSYLITIGNSVIVDFWNAENKQKNIVQKERDKVNIYYE